MVWGKVMLRPFSWKCTNPENWTEHCILPFLLDPADSTTWLWNSARTQNTITGYASFSYHTAYLENCYLVSPPSLPEDTTLLVLIHNRQLRPLNTQWKRGNQNRGNHRVASFASPWTHENNPFLFSQTRFIFKPIFNFFCWQMLLLRAEKTVTDQLFQ